MKTMKLTERERVLLYFLDKKPTKHTMKNIIDPDDTDALENAIDEQEQAQEQSDDRSWADESHPNSELTFLENEINTSLEAI